MDLNKYFGFDSGRDWEFDPDTYDWENIDWTRPLPMDCIALFALENRVSRRLIQRMARAIESGMSPEDFPRASIVTWDEIAVPSGLASAFGGMGRDAVMTLLASYRENGEMCAEDRFMAGLAEDDLLGRYLEYRHSAAKMIEDVVNGILERNNMSLDDILKGAQDAADKRNEEIAMLEQLWGES